MTYYACINPISFCISHLRQAFFAVCEQYFLVQHQRSIFNQQPKRPATTFQSPCLHRLEMTVPSPAPERLLNYDQGPQRLGMRARSFALDLGCDFADREITALQYRLTNINKALIQRGEAGCSQCLDTAKALDLHCSETTTWSNHSGMGEQQRQLLHQTLIQARHAFYGCSQHGNISNDNVSALPDTDHLLMLSMSAPSSSAVISQPPSQISKSRRENKEKDANCARTDLGSVEINPRKSDSRPAQRANIIDQMLNAVRDRSRNAVMYLANDLSWFDGLKTIAYAPVAAGRPCPEAAKDITVALVSAITQRPSKITNNERFLLFCVFKVLDSMKVPVNDIVQKFAPRHRPGPHRLKYQLQGVVWANELMEDLYSRGWGYRALDLLLFCIFISCRFFSKLY